MTVTIRHGDCREVLRTLPEGSVHCCVTSPPYFGLRDYGTAKWDGGDPACDHSPEKRGGRFASPVSSKQASNAGSGTASSRECPCGAVRVDNQIGLEPTPDAFVAELVAVFREVRRVLRADGTLWLNLGDSYAGSWGAQGRQGSSGQMASRSVVQARSINAHPQKLTQTGNIRQEGLKPKDLIGIPWMVAFALRADGWYLRQDLIWSKPNPMPESVTDRCTKAHEYIFLMSKSARYYYDAEAIAEPFSAPPKAPGGFAPEKAVGPMARSNGHSQWEKRRTLEASYPNEGRNKRSVWEIAPQPFKDAHFATFPPDLIEPCIKAGCPIGGTVLDPFGGAGTTGLVADRLKRNAILIELNESYAEMARRRIQGDAPLFAEVK